MVRGFVVSRMFEIWKPAKKRRVSLRPQDAIHEEYVLQASLADAGLKQPRTCVLAHLAPSSQRLCNSLLLFGPLKSPKQLSSS